MTLWCLEVFIWHICVHCVISPFHIMFSILIILHAQIISKQPFPCSKDLPTSRKEAHSIFCTCFQAHFSLSNELVKRFKGKPSLLQLWIDALLLQWHNYCLWPALDVSWLLASSYETLEHHMLCEVLLMLAQMTEWTVTLLKYCGVPSGKEFTCELSVKG